MVISVMLLTWYVPGVVAAVAATAADAAAAADVAAGACCSLRLPPADCSLRPAAARKGERRTNHDEATVRRAIEHSFKPISASGVLSSLPPACLMSCPALPDPTHSVGHSVGGGLESATKMRM